MILQSEVVIFFVKCLQLLTENQSRGKTENRRKTMYFLGREKATVTEY